MLFLDGVYVDRGHRFLSVNCPTMAEMMELTHKISLRIARYLEKTGFIERDAENCYLRDGVLDDSEMTTHQGHSIHFHGVFAPNHSYRDSIVKRLSDKKQEKASGEVKTEGERRAAITWAKRLKRVFDVDITICEVCCSAVKIIAYIEDPIVIKQILSHRTSPHLGHQNLLPCNRAPPSS